MSFSTKTDEKQCLFLSNAVDNSILVLTYTIDLVVLECFNSFCTFLIKVLYQTVFCAEDRKILDIFLECIKYIFKLLCSFILLWVMICVVTMSYIG